MTSSTKIYKKPEDTSERNISETIAFLNRKPARQGSNQDIKNVIQPSETLANKHYKPSTK